MKYPFSISFVVPIFNHLHETREMLSSLEASLPESLNYEIILVDDASTDGTQQWLGMLSDPRIKVLLNEMNRGYASTTNAGVKQASGTVLGLLNSDLLFQIGWLEPMIATLMSSQLNAGIVGNIQFREADLALDHAGFVVSPTGQLHHIQVLPDQSRVKVLAVTGACILLRKADFDTLGGFDEGFVNGCEDVDLCFKMRQFGKNIYIASESRIRHHVSLSRKTNSSQDLLNSRRLFSRWRPQIKHALSKVWYELIEAGPNAYSNKLCGYLEEEFFATPFAASRVIAEVMLWREESFWSRLLDDVNADMECKLGVQGLLYSSKYGAYILQNSVIFSIDRLHYVRNFYVCGQRIDDLGQPVKLIIRVNGLQTLEIELKAERDVNVGIVDPLMLPGLTNTFQVVTNRTILLTHLVVDDRVVGL